LARRKGVPIYQYANERCYFCDVPKRKMKAFPICFSTVNMYFYYKVGRWIISCPDNYKQCPYYIKNIETRYKKDIRLISKYVKKFNVKLKYVNRTVESGKNKKNIKTKKSRVHRIERGYLLKVNYRHKEWLFDRIAKGNDAYLKALFAFFGYESIIGSSEIKKYLNIYISNKEYVDFNRSVFMIFVKRKVAIRRY
jgi:hypothetical protein